MRTPLERKAHYDVDGINYFYFTVSLLLNLYIECSFLQKNTALFDNSQFNKASRGITGTATLMNFYHESRAVDSVMSQVTRVFYATKDARASIADIKEGLYRISGLVLEQSIFPLGIFESIIDISGSSNGAVFSVIIIAKVQVIATYDAIIES